MIKTQFFVCLRSFCTKPKLLVNLNDAVAQDVEAAKLKPKHHPGRLNFKDRNVPQQIVVAIEKSIKDFPLKSLVKDGRLLSQYLEQRKPPPEKVDVLRKQKDILAQLDGTARVDPSTLEEEELHNYQRQRTEQLTKILKQRVQNWKPIVYDEYKALQYLLGRSSQEYAILLNILSEIGSRDEEFKPKSYFDFGAGVGTGVWAASKLWRNSIHEYCLIDASADMNDLSALILRGGDENKEMQLKNVFHRQFLASSPVKYDLVLSGYSMMELPGYQQRMEVASNLWNKCDGYLVFVERGTRAGFQLIAEIRHHLTKASAQAFSPCPNSSPCPRQTAGDRTPCNFEITYNTLPVGDNAHNHKELYSYVVFRKHPPSSVREEDSWPRIVRPVLMRHRHTICRLCTKEGELQEVIFSPGKHGKIAYKCAKASKWGDRLPIDVKKNDTLE